MNTADDAHRYRRTNEGIRGKARHSTELSSSRSSKARIKIISTRFPVDFFEQAVPKLQLDCLERGLPNKLDIILQQATPKFCNKRSLPNPPKMWEQFRIHRRIKDERPTRNNEQSAGSSRKRLKKGVHSEQKICSYMQDVIQLTSSLKKIGKKLEPTKKYSLQSRGTIFNRENIELPPLVARNYPTLTIPEVQY